MDRTAWTRELIQEILTLNEVKGLPFHVIAKRKGIDPRNVNAAIYRYRSGKLKFKLEDDLKKTQELAKMVEDGKSIKDIAEQEGLSIQTIHNRLCRVGLDAEMRNELLGLPKHNPPRKYDKELLEQAIVLKENMTWIQVASKLNIDCGNKLRHAVREHQNRWKYRNKNRLSQKTERDMQHGLA